MPEWEPVEDPLTLIEAIDWSGTPTMLICVYGEAS